MLEGSYIGTGSSGDNREARRGDKVRSSSVALPFVLDDTICNCSRTKRREMWINFVDEIRTVKRVYHGVERFFKPNKRKAFPIWPRGADDARRARREPRGRK